MDYSPLNAPEIEAFDDLDDELLARWDPEGDAGRKYLLNPTIFRMLEPLHGKRILDAGCGQGYLCRLLAREGAEVIGVDPATRPIEYARRSEERSPLGVRYLKRDLSRLGPIEGARFDAVIANMVLLDIADWQAAVANCLGALRPGGNFVFSLLHPCWPPDAMSTWSDCHRVEITEYLQPYEAPLPRGRNFHRPLSHYLNCVLRLGATIDEIAEPAPPPGALSAGLVEIAAHIPNYIVVKTSLART